MDEELEASAMDLLSEVRAVRAWVALEKARIAGEASMEGGFVDQFDSGVAPPEQV